jgi:hypothetical protein
MFKQALIISLAVASFVPVAASAGEVQNRLNNESGRIDQGVRSGNLTHGEYHRLDNSQDRIQARRNHDLRANDGHLTGGEYRRLNRQENNLSDRIYFDKHNSFRQ